MTPAERTVLIIDDDDDVRSVTETLLSRRGVRVLSAAGGREGVDVYKQHADEIDIVLLDMAMPDMSGDAVGREILSHRPSARIIISTGYVPDSGGIAEEHLAGFLQKPYTPEMLMAQVGAAMDATDSAHSRPQAPPSI